MPRRRIKTDHAPCPVCGTAITRKIYNGRLEERSNFRRRIHCSQACMAMGMKKATVGRSAHLWRARKYRTSACEACGETRKLHVHHCDGDQTNNDPTNLQTLCQYCHDFWHALLKRRGLPVRGRVPVLVPMNGSEVSLVSQKAFSIELTSLER